MRPIFKYSGGKTKELSTIRQFLPHSFQRVIEPFAGGAAVSFALEKPCILNDIRHNNIATYNAVKDFDSFTALMEWINYLKTLDIEALNKVYYEQRDGMWGKCVTNLDYAKRWITIRQLVFSGMDRINNKTGKFNAPFGWYKQFGCNLSIEHHNLLQKSILLEDDFEKAFDLANENDFIFLDPPYYQRNSDYGGDYDDNSDLHNRIVERCKNTKAKWMMVHIDCDLYRDLYKDFYINEKSFGYSQNFKGRDNSNSKVNHLYITNYNTASATLDTFF